MGLISLFFQFLGFRFANPLDNVGGGIHHAHQRTVLVIYTDADVVEDNFSQVLK